MPPTRCGRCVSLADQTVALNGVPDIAVADDLSNAPSLPFVASGSSFQVGGSASLSQKATLSVLQELYPWRSALGPAFSIPLLACVQHPLARVSLSTSPPSPQQPLGKSLFILCHRTRFRPVFEFGRSYCIFLGLDFIVPFFVAPPFLACFTLRLVITPFAPLPRSGVAHSTSSPPTPSCC